MASRSIRSRAVHPASERANSVTECVKQECTVRVFVQQEVTELEQMYYTRGCHFLVPHACSLEALACAWANYISLGCLLPLTVAIFNSGLSKHTAGGSGHCAGRRRASGGEHASHWDEPTNRRPSLAKHQAADGTVRQSNTTDPTRQQNAPCDGRPGSKSGVSKLSRSPARRPVSTDSAKKSKLAPPKSSCSVAGAMVRSLVVVFSDGAWSTKFDVKRPSRSRGIDHTILAGSSGLRARGIDRC
jgi:hypothetical protein